MSENGPTLSEIRGLLDERDRHYRDLINGLSQRIEERFAAEDRAREESKRVLDIRLEAMNEFRAQISQERGRYVDNKKFDETVERLSTMQTEHDRRIQAIEARLGPALVLLGIVFTAMVVRVMALLI